ncbi:MAG: hypothetical protein HY040_11805 [Planctomycetes bacterium]|nr:hypothetical protein [Planctomycetota bacterium]
MRVSTLKRRARLFVGLLFLSTTSCVVESSHPLSDPAEAKPDARLAGQWRDPEKARSDMYVGRPKLAAEGLPAGVMIAHTITTFVDNEVDHTAQAFFVTKIGNEHYLNLFDPKHCLEGSKWDGEKPSPFLLVKYVVADDRLTVWTMDLDATAKAVEDGKLKGTVQRKKADKAGKKTTVSGVRLTVTSENLAAFLNKGGGKSLFTENSKVTYIRVK